MTDKARRKKTPSNKKQRRAPVIEQLEPRIMLSADLPGMDTLTHEPDDLYKVDVDRVLADADTFFALVSGDAEPSSDATADAQDAEPADTLDDVQTGDEPGKAPRHELVIVDTSVPDYETLLAGMQPIGGEETELRIVLLDPQRSGIEQVGEILAAGSGLDAIHLITHGSDGAIQIAGDTLDLARLHSEPETFSQWGGALTAEGDILIYGCDVAATVDGEALVEALANITRADIAASNDPTGHERLGGDWDLEYRTGDIEAALAVADATQMNWVGTLANTAPVLSGTNDLDVINQDQVDNAGTLVSDLIAGQVADPDDAAQYGIAVVAVDDSNGTWQFTTDGGINWYAFGVVDATAARLLAADANTSVRFVPDADWNGTVTDGITFHAWDQSSGTAGGTADLINTDYTLRDEFTTAAYTNNNGSVAWAGDWVESNDTGGATGDNVLITGGELVMGASDLSTDEKIARAADLSGATSATLTFDFRTDSGVDSADSVLIEVTSDGSNWVTLEAITGITGAISGTRSYDISAYATANTQIRFALNSGYTGSTEFFYVDNVQIAYSTGPGTGGETAFSSETASCDIRVNGLPSFWDYHHDIDLGAATPGADYPIRIELTEGVNGFSHANAQPNGEDLRFYDEAGNELSYWIESWNPVGTSVVWVEVANAGTSNIDLYYGNACVAAGGDPDATFLYYDDFTDGTVGTMPAGWTAVGGATSGAQPSVVDDGGNLVFSDGANSGGPVVSSGSWSDVVVSQDFRTISPGDPISHAGLIARYEDANNMVYGGIVTSGTAQIWYREAGTFTQIGSTWDISAFNVDDGNWHSQELRVYGNTVELYIDDTLVGSASLASTGSAAGTVGLTGFWSQYSNYDAYRDNHIVRSYDGGTGDIATTCVDEGFALDENSTNGALVGSVLATDPDGDTLSYSITGGNTDNAFGIDGNGQITVNNSLALDFETNPTFTLTILVDDSNGGTDTDTVTIALNDINDAPTASNGAVFTSEDTAYVFDAADFNFSDQDGDTLSSIRVTTLESVGSLQVNGVNVTLNQVISKADIDAGLLTFTPATNEFGLAHGTFGYRVNDGSTDSPSSYSMTVNVSSVDDPVTIGGDISGIGDEDTDIAGTVTATDVADGLTDGTYFTVTTDGTNGTATIDQVTGSWTYTPNADFNGADSFTVTITDDDGYTATQVIGITVNPLVDIVDDSLTTDEDTPITANVLTGTNGASTDDFEGSPVLSAVTQGANGAVTFDGAGNVTYMPDADFNGSDSFTYTITSGGVTETATVTVTVNPVTDVTDDSVTTDEDTPIKVDVLANDSFGPGASVTSVTQGTYGSVVIEADGTVTYSPNEDFHGADSFTYTVTTAAGDAETATVNVTVHPVDDPATIGGDVSGTGDEDTVILGTLTATDAADGLTDGTYFTVATDGSNGTASIHPATGAWTYTPNADFNGADSFTVTITDDDGHTATQVIGITVSPVADIVDDSLTTDEDTPITANVLTGTNGASVDNFEGSPVLTGVTQGSSGTVIFDGAGNVTYIPNANFNGTDSFIYTISSGGVTETATVTVTVNAVDDPVTIGGDASGAGDEDTVISGTLTATDSADGLTDGTYFTVTTDGSNGSASIDPATGAWTYTPAADFNGTDSFTVTITDDDGYTETQVISITVNPVNDAPVLDNTQSPQLAAQNEDAGGPSGAVGTLISSLVDFASPAGQMDNVTDVDVAAQLGIAVTGADTNHGVWWYSIDGGSTWLALGAVSENNARLLAADGNTRLYFQSETNWNGTLVDAITFRAWDQTSGSNGGTADAAVSYALLDQFSLVSYNNNDGTAQWSTDWIDIDGNAAGGANKVNSGVLVIRANNTTDWICREANLQDTLSATLSFDYTNNFSEGVGGLVYLQVSSNGGASYATIATFSDSVYTGGGTFSADISGYASTDTRVRFLTAGDSDPTKTLEVDNFQIAYSVYGGGSSAFSGVADTASLTVNPVADLSAQDDSFGTDEDTVLNADVSTNDSTTSGGVLTYALDTNATNGSVVMSPDGSFTYTPNANYNGPDSFSYTVTDADSGESDTRTVTLTVNPVADPPVLGGVDSGSVTEDTDPDLDGLLEVGGALTISDPDAGESSFQPATVVGTYGSLTIDAAGSWTYAAGNAQWIIQQLDVGESLSDVMTVTTADGTTHDITITITGAEDVPVLTGTTGGVVTEDGTPNATGTLSITDVDTSDNPVFFPDEGASLGDNGYGNFTLIAGTWDYALNNAHPDVQALDTGETRTDTHAFVASDGSTHLVSITITGAEDAPVVTGVLTGSVAEDGTMTAGGALSISDVDRSDNPVSFGNRSELPGDRGLGRFGVSAAGWTYTLDNALASVQALDAGESISDSYTFVASDGSRATATVTISGAEDVPVISGTTRGEVVADQVLTASGSLSISDIDANDNPVGFPDQAPIPGENGYGTFLLSGSTWVYRLDNVHPAVSGLRPGEALEDRYAFTASDGSMQTVMVQIKRASVVEEPPPPAPPEISVKVDPVPTSTEPDEVAEVVDDATPEDSAEIVEALNVSPSPIGGLDASGDTDLIRVPLSEDVLTSVLATRDGGQKAPPADKPSAEAARTFVQELKSFWKDDMPGFEGTSPEGGQSRAFWSGLDRMLADLDQNVQEVERQQQLNAEVAAGIGVSLTAGFVTWALRAGSIVASFLAAMPTWRNFDPMPVLARDEEDKKRLCEADDADTEKSESEIESEAKVDAMFDR